MATQLSSTTQKAIKRHHCDSCNRGIEVGEIYHRSRMVDGGDAWVFKCHVPCRKAGDILWDAGIQNEGEFIVNVDDMDREDREMVERIAPDVHAAIWGPDGCRPLPPPNRPSGEVLGASKDRRGQ